MIQLIETGWLSASSKDGSTRFVDLTFEIPNLTVLATTAISAFSAGLHEHVPGSVATYIREVASFTGPHAIKITDLPGDPANNSVYVEKCAFIRFRLAVFQATAWSQASVFHYAPVPVKKKPVTKIDLAKTAVEKSFVVRDKDSGKTLGTHIISTLGKGSRIAVEELLERSTEEALSHYRLQRRNVEVLEQTSHTDLLDPSKTRTIF